MLHKNVTERYRTMADVAADLAKFLRNDKDIPAALRSTSARQLITLRC